MGVLIAAKVNASHVTNLLETGMHAVVRRTVNGIFIKWRTLAPRILIYLHSSTETDATELSEMDACRIYGAALIQGLRVKTTPTTGWLSEAFIVIRCNLITPGHSYKRQDGGVEIPSHPHLIRLSRRASTPDLCSA